MDIIEKSKLNGEYNVQEVFNYLKNRSEKYNCSIQISIKDMFDDCIAKLKRTGVGKSVDLTELVAYCKEHGFKQTKIWTTTNVIVNKDGTITDMIDTYIMFGE